MSKVAKFYKQLKQFEETWGVPEIGETVHVHALSAEGKMWVPAIVAEAGSSGVKVKLRDGQVASVAAGEYRRPTLSLPVFV